MARIDEFGEIHRDAPSPEAFTSAPAPPPQWATVTDSAPAGAAVVLYPHSLLFYWWPVWVVGFVMALWSWIDQPGAMVLTRGALFLVTVFVVLVATNLPFSGPPSVVVLSLVVFAALTQALFGNLESWLARWPALAPQISGSAYLLVSIVLLLLWLSALFFVDQNEYVIVEPGQVRICARGRPDRVVEWTGLTLVMTRSELFRHWVLGLGSGNVTLWRAGADALHMKLPNVLFASRKMWRIEHQLGYPCQADE
jgi:hypothetical protein